MPVSATKRILIGIPSFRRPDGLSRLLLSLEQQEGMEAFEIEVFVADNDAEHREGSAVCREVSPKFRWPLNCAVVEKRGISEARNAILDQARLSCADSVAMIDDDQVAAPNWLRELVRAQKEIRADVIAGPVPPVFEGEPSVAVRKSGYFSSRLVRDGAIDSLDATGNVLLACSKLRDLGWPRFDPAFGRTGGEDKEYFARLKKAGVTFGWASAAIAYEDVPAQRGIPSWVLQRAFRVGQNDMRILRMHEGGTAVAASLGKAFAVLLSSPVLLPLLLIPERRLWLLGKWARSIGKLAAFRGTVSSSN